MSTPYYESDRGVAEYLLFHFATWEETLPPAYRETGPRNAHNFAARLVSEALAGLNLPADAKALDLGCAVGRTSFELTKLAKEVTGIDFSHAFIETANRLQESGTMTYDRVDEGTRTTALEARLPEGTRPERAHFEQGDATQLRDGLGPFDLVVMANLICRLPDPRACIAQLPSLVRPQGYVLLTSPYTWLEEHTPTGSWVGASPEATSHDALTHLLQSQFDLVRQQDMPFLIREHARKYQWSVAEATLWQKKSA